jgi:hypothetical protein
MHLYSSPFRTPHRCVEFCSAHCQSYIYSLLNASLLHSLLRPGEEGKRSRSGMESMVGSEKDEYEQMDAAAALQKNATDANGADKGSHEDRHHCLFSLRTFSFSLTICPLNFLCFLVPYSPLGFVSGHDDGVSMLTADEYITVSRSILLILIMRYSATTREL